MFKRAMILFPLLLVCELSLGGGPDGLISPLIPLEEKYRLDVRLSLEKLKLEGSGTITVKNSTGSKLEKLGLIWSDKKAETCEVILDGQTVTVEGTSSEPLVLRLKKPMEIGEEKEIRLRFGRSIEGIDPGQALKLTNWHPRLWVEYDRHASYDVGVAAPEHLLTATSARQDPVDGRYRADDIRSFGLFFGNGFEGREAMSGATLVRGVFPVGSRDCSQALVENAVDAIEFYRQKYGLYPQSSLTIIPGEPAPVSGGFPFATAMVALHGTEGFSKRSEGHWRWIIAHEVGHQYWLEHVFSYEPVGRWSWLMIGLGIMADRDYCRSRDMEDRHSRRLVGYADTVRKGMDTTVEQAPEKVRKLKYSYNSQVTHNKGYGILSALAAILTKETFERIETRCLREYAGERLSTFQFRRVAEEESGQDLGWLFGPFLTTNKYASYEIASIDRTIDAGSHVASVTVRNVGEISMPVLLEARFADGTTSLKWTDRHQEEQFLEFRSAERLSEVVIDPDRELPLIIPPPTKEFQALATKVVESPWSGVGETALELHKEAVRLKLADGIILRKLGLLLYDGGYYTEALEHFGLMASLLENDQDNVVGYYYSTIWQGLLLDLLGRREEAISQYQKALETGLDIPIQHSQYGLVLDRSFLEERLVTPFVRE